MIMNILIAEDERKTAELLKEFVESNPGHLVVNILDSIENSVRYLSKYQDNIDLLFLDIHLADGQAFKIFDQIQVNVPVVFCTAYDEYVLKAFKNNGIDYVLKPFEEEDIATSLRKFHKLKSSLSKGPAFSSGTLQAMMQEEKRPQKSFIVHNQDKMIPVAVERIAFFHLENELVRVYCFDNQQYSMLKRMDEIQAVLDKELFFRINRQMILHRNAVKEIEPFFNRKVIVQPTIPIPKKAIVSRLKVTPFLSWLEKPAT